MGIWTRNLDYRNMRRRRIILLLVRLALSLYLSLAISFHIYNTNEAVRFLKALLTRLLEQKRRQAIREGFDRLTELVPGLEGQGRSESVVLKKTVDYMRAQLDERRKLVSRIEELGGQVEDGMKR